MPTLVTGATGFVGAHVARGLVERGDSVRAGYRNAKRLERLGDLEVEPIAVEILDLDAMRAAMRGCETVFHVAGFVGSEPVGRDLGRGVRADGPGLALHLRQGQARARLPAAPAPADGLGDRRGYLDLIGSGSFDGSESSALSVVAEGLGAAGRLGLLWPLRPAEKLLRRRLIAGR